MERRRAEKRFPILLVEDEPVTAARLKKTLCKAGYTVTVAHNGKEALGLFAETFFPFVLTDWEMPELGGLELCRMIRECFKTRYCYIVILTGRHEKNDTVTGLKAGADDFIKKPSTNNELLARVNAGMRVLDLEESLVNAREEIRNLSITDSLTGCYNRAYLDEHLANELERARRYGRYLSVLFCDLDHFKQVNDNYGHKLGDNVLRVLAQCINHTIRQHMDWTARYGGEEFLIVAPETTIKGAGQMAERIRSAISKLEIEAPSQILHVTASFGVSGISPGPDERIVTADALIDQADKQLYRAKMDGRNCVSVEEL